MAKLENYKGSVKLIAGITQQNNSDFALVEANAVQVDEEGKRLDQALEDLAKLAGQAGVDKEQVIEILNQAGFEDLKGDVVKNTSSIEEINEEIKSINEVLTALPKDGDKQWRLHYDDTQYLLYLWWTNGEEDDSFEIALDEDRIGGEPVEIKGGGGGDDVDTYPVVITLQGEGAYSYRYGDKAYISFTFENKKKVEGSYEYDSSTGTASISVNGITKKTITSLMPGQDIKTYEISEYLTPGVNSVKLTITNEYGRKSSKNWTINAVDLQLNSSFDDSVVAVRTPVVISYTATGSVDREVVWTLDNGEEKVESFRSSNVSGSGTIRFAVGTLTHGDHVVKMRLRATVGGTLIETPVLYFNFMYDDKTSKTPIIRCSYDGTPLEQNNPYIFKYSVYTPPYEENKTTSIKTCVQNSKGEILVQNNSVVTRDEQQFVFTPTSFGEGYSFIIQIDEKNKKVIPFDVEVFDIDIEEVGGISFDFKPDGRTNSDVNRALWTYTNGNTTYQAQFSEHFDWDNGGWKTTEEGESYLLIKAGSYVTFDYPLFGAGKEAVTASGKNFKIIFKTENVGNFEAKIAECLNNTVGDAVGLKLNAQDGYLYFGGNSVLEVPYEDEEKIEFEINITSSEHSEIVAYLEADPSRAAIYDKENAKFTIDSSTYIKFGSEECDVLLYRFKVYENALSQLDIMTNFYLDAPTGKEVVKRYNRNNFLQPSRDGLTYYCYFDEFDRYVDIKKIMEDYPDLRIILLECDRFTRGKKDSVNGAKVIHLQGNGGVEHNWYADNVTFKGQGTSSEYYGAAGRNIDLNFKNTKEFILGYGLGEDQQVHKTKMEYAMTSPVYETDALGNIIEQEGKKVVKTPGSVPVNYFNLKVNIASSENANNAVIANRYNEYQPFKRTAKKDGVRDTMEFHPCVLFIKETDDSRIEFDNNPPEVYHFYACGDFGNSKKNSAAFGTTRAKEGECIIEFGDNTTAQCLFQYPPGVTDPNEAIENLTINTETGGLMADTDTTSYMWNGSPFEFRYPDMGDFLDKASVGEEEYEKNSKAAEFMVNKFRKLWEWTASTNPDTATNTTLPEPVSYGGVTYTQDTPDYRRAKFAAEYDKEGHYAKDSLLYHYLFTERFLLVDNRAKNTFIHYDVDSERWDFVFDYDNDTAEGNDNSGGLKFDYGMEDIDSIGGSPVFNASGSVLWRNVRDTLSTDLKSMVSNSLNAKAFASQDVIKTYSDYQQHKPEMLQLMDMQQKYLRPHEGYTTPNPKDGNSDSKEVRSSAYINMLLGRKTHQRSRFEKYRGGYISSKYGVLGTSSAIVFRAQGVKQNYIDVTPFAKTYFTVVWDTEANTEQIRLTEINKPHRFESKYLSKQIDGNFYDKNTQILNPQVLTSIGDISGLFPGNRVDFSLATKIKDVTIGSKEDWYQTRVNVNQFALTTNRLLEKLDVSNVIFDSDSTALNLSNNLLLKTLEAEGSNIVSVSFPENGIVEKVKLGNKITSLTMKNLRNLKSENFSAQDLSGLIKIDYTQGNDNFNLFDSVLDHAGDKLNEVTIKNINWKLDDASVLVKLLKAKSADGKSGEGWLGTNLYHGGSILTGHVTITRLRESERAAFEKAWGGDDDVPAEDKLIIDYDELIPQHLVTYRNPGTTGGDVLYTELVDKGSTTSNPIDRGLVSTPTRPSTAQYNYTFSKWEYNFNIPITADTVIYAKYDEETRWYKVTWYETNADNATKLLTKEYEYGKEAVYDNKGNKIPERATTQGIAYIFKGWDKSTAFVGKDGKDMRVNALWNASGIPSAGTKINTFTAVQMKAARDIMGDTPLEGDGYNYATQNKADYINVRMGYIPSLNADKEKELISLDAEQTYNGSNYTVFDTQDIYPFESKDKEFTLICDFTYKTNELDKTILSCCYLSGGVERGFRISTNGSGIPSLYYNTAQYTITGAKAYSSSELNTSVTNPPVKTQSYRQIVVIRHERGSDDLKIYSNDRSSLPDEGDTYGGVKITTANLYDAYPESKDAILSVGCRYYKNGASNSVMYSQKAVGKVSFLKYYDYDLGEEECLKAAIWPLENREFVYIDSQRYSGADNTFSFASFVDTNLLDVRFAPFNITAIGGWKYSKMSDFFQLKLYPAIDLEWRQLIKNVKVPTAKGGIQNQPTQIKSTNYSYKTVVTADSNTLAQNPLYLNSYIYAPSVREVNNNADNSVSVGKLHAAAESYTPYNCLSGETNRKKMLGGVEIINGGSNTTITDAQRYCTWYTRSPILYDSSSTSNSFDRNEIVTPTGAVATYTSDITSTATSLLGILMAFSI